MAWVRQPGKRSRIGTALAIATAFGCLVLTGVTPTSVGASTSGRETVDLSTSVDMSHGFAHQAAVIKVGHVRVEVLGPTLLRLEYSPTDHFENSPTVNALNRQFAVPHYTWGVVGGVLTVQTSRATLRYRIAGGPFSAADTTLTYDISGRAVTENPTWEWECPYDQVCQAGDAVLGGSAAIGTYQNGFVSTGGFVGYFQTLGANASWHVLGAPGGQADIAVRYANYAVAGFTPTNRSADILVNGKPAGVLSLPPTTTATQWVDATATIDLQPGTNVVELRCDADDTCGGNFDSLSVGPATAPAPVAPSLDPLGGWIRGFDDYTNLPDPVSCSSGESGATCQAGLEPLQTDGLLNAAGFDLLDDSQSALYTSSGWVAPRPANGDLEDGYLFVYGHDYEGALKTFAQLTGSAPLLNRSAFGVWYSDYTPYSSATIEHSLVPAFRANGVPLDNLLLDTDWKAPNDWDGWEWNGHLFPNAAAFVKWLGTQGIHLDLNVHSSVDDHDPKLPATEKIAGGKLASSSCSAGPCKVFDWSSEPQAEANFALQQSFLNEGVSGWWLDWCCDASTVSLPGLTPDNWVDHLYAQQMIDAGQRGYVLSRIGASEQQSLTAYPAGVWSGHTSAIAFTGDAWGTWNTLQRQVELTPDEASVGEPYVSDDIGSYHGPPPGAALDPPDLYDRWVQLGTFQPILRLHSNDLDRLPWQYPEPVRGITEDFLRLREALVPYTYTLAYQAHSTGAPIDAPLYVDYPNTVDAYLHPDEFMFGSQMLVAPVITPGSEVTQSVWLPAGEWVDYFTGATYAGPGDVTVSVPLNQMPVFVRAGGIVPEQPSSTHVVTNDDAPMTLKVFPGGDSKFNLYDDAGSGLGYTRGQYSLRSIVSAAGSEGGVASSSVTINPSRGRFPGQATSRTYTVDMVDLTRPQRVVVRGSHSVWSYDRATSTLVVTLPKVAPAGAVTVTQYGGSAITAASPT